MHSLTVLSKKYLEDKGYIVERVEYYNFFAKCKVDLLGIGDLLALNGKEILLVQVTSSDHLANRMKKAGESEKLKLWLKAGGKFVGYGWSKKGKRNERKSWQVREKHL